MPRLPVGFRPAKLDPTLDTVCVCLMTVCLAYAGIPEAEATSKKWTDEYLESQMASCPRCNVMKSGETIGPLLYDPRAISTFIVPSTV